MTDLASFGKLLWITEWEWTCIATLVMLY